MRSALRPFGVIYRNIRSYQFGQMFQSSADGLFVSSLRAILSDFYHMNILPLRQTERNVRPLVFVSSDYLALTNSGVCLFIVILSSELILRIDAVPY
jgi:hypothetical protein